MRRRVLGLLAAIGVLWLWVPACTEQVSQVPITDEEAAAAIAALKVVLWVDGRLVIDLQRPPPPATPATGISYPCGAGGTVEFFPPLLPVSGTQRPSPAAWRFENCIAATDLTPLNGGASAEAADSQGSAYVFEIAIKNLQPPFSIDGNGTIAPSTAPVFQAIMQDWAQTGAAGSVGLTATSYVVDAGVLELTGEIARSPITDDPLGTVNTKAFECAFVNFDVLAGDYATDCKLVPRF